VKGIVLITAGFKEIEDQKGQALQSEVTKLARIGPASRSSVQHLWSCKPSSSPQRIVLLRNSPGWQGGNQPGPVRAEGMSQLNRFSISPKQGRMSKIIGLGNRCNVDFPEMVNT